jgi:MYXO-CTERM domain-containing protein
MLELLKANRSTCPTVVAPAVAILAVFVLTASPAYAHFILTTPGAWETSTADGSPQKAGPCGNEGGGTPTGMVTDYQPGQTVTITVTPTIPHPGWWRVALIQGASSTQTATSLTDPAYTAAGVSVGTTTCVAAVPATINNPVWSPTQPVILDGMTSSQSTTPEQLQVTLPQNITCTAQRPCALQVIMIMNDGHITGPNGSAGCYYHHCADITIGAASADAGASSSSSGGSGSSGGSTGSSSSGASSGAHDAGVSSSSSGSSSSGASTSGGSGGSSGTTRSGGSSGATSSGGSSGTNGTTGGSSGSSGSAAATGDDGGSAAATGQGMPSSNGCGCAQASGGGTPTAVGVAGLIGFAALRRRRRRR